MAQLIDTLASASAETGGAGTAAWVIRGLRTRSDVVPMILSVVVVVAAWEGFIRLTQTPSYIFPAPSLIWNSLVAGVTVGPTASNGYWLHTWQTLREAVVGYLIGVSLGLALGVLLYQFPLLHKLVLPYIIALQSLPKVALAPLLIVWLGFGAEPKVTLVVLLTFFPMMVNCLAGLRSVEADRLELMRSFGASRWRVLRFVLLPGALPYIFAGLEIALVYSLLGAVVGELVGGRVGLGVLLIQRTASLDLAGVFGVFVVMALLGIVLNWLLRFVRRRVLFWMPAERQNVRHEGVSAE
jgi:NitT/TauT family transport system permease protein